MRRLAAAVATAALVGCAPAGPSGTAPAGEPAAAAPGPEGSAVATAIVREQGRAQAAQAAGDLAAAASHYEVLTLLDPGNATYRQALETTRAAIDRTVRERSAAATAARRAGDMVKARDAWLRVLALDPSNADAVRGLREIEQQTMARLQAGRAARARSMDEVAAARNGASGSTSTDLEQCIELVRSGQPAIALRESRAWSDGNPGDRAGRQRLGSELLDRGRDLEGKGQREAALAFYDQARSLGGPAQSDAAARANGLRRTLADEAYAQGMRARSTDLAAAIRYFEEALKLDPQLTRASDRLRETKTAQQKLERAGK